MWHLTCADCGQQFKSPSGRSKFCSECRAGSGKPATSPCEVCGVEVAQKPTGPVAKLCPDHRRAARRRTVAAAQQRFREAHR